MVEAPTTRVLGASTRATRKPNGLVAVLFLAVAVAVLLAADGLFTLVVLALAQGVELGQTGRAACHRPRR